MEVINEKQRKFAINFILYIFAFCCLIFIGIKRTLAYTYTDIGDQANITVVLISTAYGSQPYNVPINSFYNFNQVLQVDYLINNYNFDANRHYQLETHLTNQTFTNANSYSVTGLNGESCLIDYSASIFTGAYPRWDFQCPHATSSITLSIKNSSNQYLWDNGIYTWTSALLKYSTTSISSGSADTDAIINNNNQNTNNIINNQNQNTQQLLDELKNNNTTCAFNYKQEFNYDKLSSSGVKLSDGSVVANQYFRHSEPTIIFGGYSYDISGFGSGSVNYYTILVYDKDMNYLRTIDYRSTTTLDLSSYNGLMYIVANVNNNVNNKLIIVSKDNICVPTTYANNYQQNQINDSINNLDDSIKDDDVSDAEDEASEFFSSFTTNTFGLTSIITAPLNLIQSILSVDTFCIPLQLPLPYLSNKYLTLPCMYEIYNRFGAMFYLYQYISYGVIAYWVIVRIFNQVKDFKNPEHDEIEVLDL